jgi:DNA adenine methylase
MKYLGGKQRLGKHIAIFLKEIWNKCILNDIYFQKYLEPFCGSLGVLKNMTDIPTHIVANDYHPDLIEMWKCVRDKTLVFPESVSEEEYNNAKQIQSPSALKSFIGFGLSFGGRYFGAFAHKYVNDKNEDFCKEMRNSLTRMTPLIQNVEFTNKKYQELTSSNTFIYCDPPYKQTKYPIKYRIGTKKYDKFDTDEFWETMRKWSDNNLVIVSELSAPNDFVEIWNLNRYRSACQSTKTRFKQVNETETHQIEKMFVYSKSKYLPFIVKDI